MIIRIFYLRLAGSILNVLFDFNFMIVKFGMPEQHAFSGGSQRRVRKRSGIVLIMLLLS